MRTTLWRGFDIASATVALSLSVLSMRTVLTTPHISTVAGLFLVLLSYGCLMAAAAFGGLALERPDRPVSIRPKPERRFDRRRREAPGTRDFAQAA
jgi:hypothetical protein